MIEDLQLTIIQSDLKWQDKEANLNNFTELFKKIDVQTDLIILPEMFTTGFSMESSLLSETMNGESVEWMLNRAKENNAVIVGSIIIEENGNYYNRLLWVEPDGNMHKYDKRHLFRMANENDYFTQGELKLVVEYKGWKICPLICYDLRFPVWSRNAENYDLLIYIANWPEKRSYPWQTLLLARAIENQTYCVGVNRIGTDNNNIDYSGNSAVIDPKGNYLYNASPGEEIIQTVSLSYNNLAKYREEFPVELDNDSFHLL